MFKREWSYIKPPYKCSIQPQERSKRVSSKTHLFGFFVMVWIDPEFQTILSRVGIFWYESTVGLGGFGPLPGVTSESVQNFPKWSNFVWKSKLIPNGHEKNSNLLFLADLSRPPLLLPRLNYHLSGNNRTPFLPSALLSTTKAWDRPITPSKSKSRWVIRKAQANIQCLQGMHLFDP
jgi:hypothetical protein